MDNQGATNRHVEGETVALPKREWIGLRRMRSAFTARYLEHRVTLVLSDGRTIRGNLGGVGPEHIRVSNPKGGYDTYLWDKVETLAVDTAKHK